MRLLVSLAVLFAGIGLWLVAVVTDAFTNARALSVYQKHLQSLPVKEIYSRAEVADAAWQVWTNRVSLPEQSTYTVGEIKAALVRPLLGSRQDSCDRHLFEHAIGTVAGYRGNSDKQMILVRMVGIVLTFAGAFLVGRVLFPSVRKEAR